MEELVRTFHIDYKLVIAQLINFVVILFVFKRYAYGPILKMLNERSNKIEKGLVEAKEAAQKLAQAEEIKKGIVAQAKTEAHEIILKAEQSGDKLKKEIIEQSKANAEKIIERATASIEEEKRKILLEIKEDVSGLVVSGMKKLLEEGKEKDKFNERAIQEIAEDQK